MLSTEAIRRTLLQLPTHAHAQIEVLMQSPTDTNAHFLRGYVQCLLQCDLIDDECVQQTNLLISTIVFNARIGAVMNEEGL